MITSKIKESKGVEEQTFPRLMKFDDGVDECVALFQDENHATVVNVFKGHSFVLGEYQDYWDINEFKPFKGTIELTQE